MHKELHILGLLLTGPKTGYDLHRIVVAHGDLFADLKKGNTYYLLERLAQADMLEVHTEAGARGPRRERLVYTLTPRGRERFSTLLREVIRTYDPPHAGVEVGMVFLPRLDLADALDLLEERRQAVIVRRAAIAPHSATDQHLHENLARDHLLCLIDAELDWIDQTTRRLRQRQRELATPTEPFAPPWPAPEDHSAC